MLCQFEIVVLLELHATTSPRATSSPLHSWGVDVPHCSDIWASTRFPWSASNRNIIFTSCLRCVVLTWRGHRPLHLLHPHWRNLQNWMTS